MRWNRANVDDIHRLVALRKRQLLDEGQCADRDIDASLNSFFFDAMQRGRLVQWIAEEGEEIVATGAIVFFDFPPSYANPDGKRAYVTNMYTLPSHRRRGLATQALDHLMAEARSREVSHVWLGASALGRPVYERYGFTRIDGWLELRL